MSSKHWFFFLSLETKWQMTWIKTEIFQRWKIIYTADSVFQNDLFSDLCDATLMRISKWRKEEILSVFSVSKNVNRI